MQASTAGTQATGGAAAEVAEQPADATVDAVTAQLGAVIKQAMHGSQGAMLTALEDLGISLSQLKALGALENQEQIPLSELAERMQLSLPAVSRLVEGLVKRGWATREEAPDDRRCKLIQITPEALATYRELAALRISALRAFVETLSSEELRRARARIERSSRRPTSPRFCRGDPRPMTARFRLNEDNRRWWTLGAMCFALFMIMLDNTVVNVALPSIQEDLGASLSALEWTVNAYTLTFAVLLVTGGRLGDIFGRRRMFLFGVVVFARLERVRSASRRAHLPRRQPRDPGHRRRVHDAGAPSRSSRTRSRPTSAARRSAPGPASPRWRSRSAPSSAASSPSTSPGARSSSSTSRSPPPPSP